jgi:hypothetical protein
MLIKSVIVFLLFFSLNVHGQLSEVAIKFRNDISKNNDLSKIDYKDSLVKFDFSNLWTQTDNKCVVGFIGDNYQRIRIKFLSVAKDVKHPNIYIISGISKVKDNICKFKGTIEVKNIWIYKNLHWGVDDDYKNKGIKSEGMVVGEYHFMEDSTIKYSGKFDGIESTKWYIDQNGEVKYDNIQIQSDSYCNNQFVGTWRGYKATASKRCNWGDYRIPFSGDLDVGEGDFSPNEKYLKYGWSSYKDSHSEKDWW